MIPNPNPRSLWSLEALAQREALALIQTANLLKNAQQSGNAKPLLRGKNLALLGNVPTNGSAGAFDRAATELGAKVAHLQPTRTDVPHTARLLGRLYDAIECDNLPDEFARELQRHANIPVFNGLAGPDHPSRVLAEMMSGAGASAEDVAENRHYVLQAMLLSTLS